MSASPAHALSSTRVLDQQPEVPLAFVPNAGQWPDDVRFALGSESFGVTLKDDAILFHYADAEAQQEASPNGHGRRRVARYRTGSVEMKLVGGVLRSPVGLDARPGALRHVGTDGAELSLSRHGRVVYQDVYPGVDLVFRAHDGLVEYDFEVAPDADASQIELAFDGSSEARLEGDGSLVVPTPSGGSFRHGVPALDQDDGRGGRAKVQGGWRHRGRGRLGFEIGPHDKRRALRIDPTVVYTASGGSSFQDRSSGIARDAAGNVYLAYQRFLTGGTTPGAWIAKFDAAGTFVTETSFGGTCVGLSSIAVDAAGDIYVAGGACGPIPLVNAYQSTLPPLNVLSEVALVARLRPDLSVAYSTYFGGTQRGLGYAYVDEYALDVAAGAAGRVAISGWSYSADLPTPNGYQTSNTSYLATFVAVFDTTASGAASLLYSTYLGSALGYAEGKSVAVDATGNVYVTGYDAPPSGAHFPTKNGFQDVQPAGSPSYMDDAFLARLDPSKAGAESLVYSTLFGGTKSESGTALAVDGAGNAYVAGFTRSSDLPTTPGVYSRDNPDAAQSQVFVAKIDTAAVGAASRRWATYVGPGSANGIAIDSAGRSFVVGQTTSPAFPTTPDAIPPNTGYPYIFALDPSASALAYSTRLAGTGGYPNDNEARGIVYDETTFTAYVAGHTFGTTSSDLFVIGVRHAFEDARIEILATTCDAIASTFAAASGPACTLGTTRWRPQRDNAKSIDIRFRSTSPLKSATVTLTGPSVVAPITATFDLANPPDPYQVVWNGVATDASGNVTYLNRGDYKVTIEGVQEDGTTIQTGENDPNATVSLVEVKKVELCLPDDTDECVLLTDVNPAVGSLPGQDPPQERPAAGKRIFAEAATPSGPPNNRVKVRAITDPVIPADPSRAADVLVVPVYFKAFDVDDPAPYAPDLDGDPSGQQPSDNRGSPKQGVVEPAVVNLAAGQTKVTTFFRTSLQPGDNYRVAVSTSQEWLSGLQAAQPSLTGELALAGEGKETNVSEMLTVWRSLHLELDSMAAAPSDDLPERNFIEGRVLAIEGDPTKATSLRLADTGFVTLGLNDRSPDLDRTSGVEGKGRFQNGTIRLGLDGPGIAISNLEGNGLNFVRKVGAIDIPFDLRDPGRANLISGKVLAWDADPRRLTFTVSSEIPPNTYTNGTIAIGGVEWSVVVASGREVMVAEKDFPFFLVDDDSVTVPFAPNASLLQASDDPTENLLAQAYIRPLYDLANPRHEAPFNRNISTPRRPDGEEDRRDFDRQIGFGRDAPSSPSNAYWAGYVQFAYQPDEAEDFDPGTELDAALGWTIGDASYVFSEIVAEQVRGLGAELTDRCQSAVLAHEVGHQLGLNDPVDRSTGSGVMVDPCYVAYHYFAADEIDRMRSKGVSR